MIDKNQRITYFLYARKSSESEDRQVQSIDDQINRLKELAGNIGISIKEVLIEAKSAKKPNNRDVFSKMLERIEKGDAQGILCWQINRLSRNPIDSGRLSWMLQQGALKSIQTIDRQYLPDDNVLLFNVESGMANQFIIDLRKNSRRGMEGKADRGWLPSRAPLGYLNEKLEHTIVVDEDRFELVRKMWDLMLTGNFNPSKICEIANKDWGFRVPKTRNAGGGELSLSVVYKMFNSIFYTGMFEWDNKTYQGNHKPMISMDEFDRVQIILGKKGKPRAHTHEFAYTGLIKCEVCGSMYTASEKKKILKNGDLKTYVYYHCTRKKKDVVCDQREPVTLLELENQIDAELKKVTILPEFQKWALDILNRNNDKEIKERANLYEAQHKGVSEVQKELDGLTKMRYRDLIDDETFIKERDSLKAKIVRLKANLRQTEGRAEKWLELTEQTFVFATHARAEFAKGDLQKRREIFSALGSNFSIKDGKLKIDTNEWLVPIQKSYPALESEYNRLELDNNLTVEARNDARAQLIVSWGAYRESNSGYRFHKPKFYH